MKNQKINFNYADFDVVKTIALTFPDTEESISHGGTPSVKVRGKLMCRLHGSGEFIPIRLNFDIRDRYLESHPEIFHLPDHFKSYPYICMWVHDYDTKLLTEVLERSWKVLATKKRLNPIHALENLLQPRIAHFTAKGTIIVLHLFIPNKN